MTGSALVQTGTVDAIVEAVARHVEQLGALDLRQSVELAGAAEEAAQATTLRRYRRIEEHAERAQRALEGLALQASLRAGELLAELEGGGPGKAKSARTQAAEAAGIDGRLVRRLVELAQLDQDQRVQAREQLVLAGKRLTVRGVLAAADKRTSVGTDEWYTTEEFVAAAVELFGGPPDCDPASCVVAQAVIQAKRWWSASEPTLGPAEEAAGITAEELEEHRKTWAGIGVVYRFPSGEVIEPDESLDPAARTKAFARAANGGRLSHAPELAGTVWLNPPYAFPAPFVRAVIEAFLGRTIEQIWDDALDEIDFVVGPLDHEQRMTALERASWTPKRAGPVDEALILVNVATGTLAGQLLLAVASSACWVSGRISFRDATGEPQDGNRYEQVVFYLGNDPQAFRAAFSRFGVIT